MKGCFIVYILNLCIACVFCKNGIPNSILKEIEETRSTKEFFEKFVEGGYVPASGTFVQSHYLPLPGQKISLDAIESAVILTDSPGKCQPFETTVDVPLPPDPSWFTFPQCVKIKLCAGCCLPFSTSCQPKRTALRTYRVTHFEFNSATSKLEAVREVYFSLKEHLECGCQCSIKASNCTEHQDYDESSCSCVCRNNHESQDCRAKHKVWDSDKCQCLCKETRDCPLGYFFNPITCRCQYIPPTRKLNRTSIKQGTAI